MSDLEALQKAIDDARYNRTYDSDALDKPDLTEVLRRIADEEFWNEHYNTPADHTDAMQRLNDCLLVALGDALEQLRENVQPEEATNDEH